MGQKASETLNDDNPSQGPNCLSVCQRFEQRWKVGVQEGSHYTSELSTVG